MAEKRALVSVSDKTGLEEFVKALDELGFEIISTGGTAEAIKAFGVRVTPVEKVTQFQEMLDGRVKTLHPKIHAGILALRDSRKHIQQLKEANIFLIDLVVVNLYPFMKTIQKRDASWDEIIENIDIGGPTLIRAAAKNYHDVAVVVSPKQYKPVIEELRKSGELSLKTRERLAARAFEHTAFYDANINQFLHNKLLKQELFPEDFTVSFHKMQECRYGENPHQKGAFYKETIVSEPCVASARQLHGKELSFNNVYDANAAIELVKEFGEAAAAIIKHSNPCGCAVSESLEEAFKRALECDSLSAFGGIIALNRECNAGTASLIASFFNEVVIAPSFEEEALDILKQKKDLRVLGVSGLGGITEKSGLEMKKVVGGMLVQERDLHELKESDLRVVSSAKPASRQIADMLFGTKVIKHVKSNAILLIKDKATVGIGAGQMSRIDATEIAVKKSNGKCRGAVLISDAFFPFRDNVDLAAKAGVAAIIEPGGSIRDAEVIDAANEHKIPLVFSGIRHFKH